MFAQVRGTTQPSDLARSPRLMPSHWDVSFGDTALSKVIIQHTASCSCGGGCPTCQAKSSNLKCSQPDDPAEIEADRIADKVMGMPEGHSKPVSLTSNSLSPIHHNCDTPEDEQKLHRKAVPLDQRLSSQTRADLHRGISSGGHPLDDQIRSFFEPRLGYDLSSVRVHTDPTAGQSARSVNARAYTLGSNIAFAKGEYHPETDGGKRLLAHELAHVMQQGTEKIHTLQRQRADESADEGEDLCSEEREMEARESIDNAYHAIRRTVHRINSDHEGTADDLRYYFGESYDRGVISLRLGEIQSFIRDGVIVRCADPSSDPECRPDVLAYCHSHSSLFSRIFNDRTIHVCQPNFHRLTVSMRIATMVHETAHLYLGLNDNVGYSEIDCRATEPTVLSARDLSTNADSYGCLVYRLGGRDP